MKILLIDRNFPGKEILIKSKRQLFNSIIGQNPKKELQERKYKIPR